MTETETLLCQLAAACMYGEDNPDFELGQGVRAQIRDAAKKARAHINKLDFDGCAKFYKTALSPTGHYVGINSARKVKGKWFFDCRHIGGALETFRADQLTNFVL